MCLYFKGNLCLRQIDISFFPDCFPCQININNEKGYIIVLYRSPSQTFEFNNFQHNLDKILNDVEQLGSNFLIMLDDFNTKSKTWWTHDITTNEGVQIESLTSTYDLGQLISDSTLILPNSSSCIDLIFIDQPNLVVDGGVIHHCILIGIIKLFIVNSISSLSTHHHMNNRHGIINMLILVQSKNHLTKLTGINYSKTKISMNK